MKKLLVQKYKMLKQSFVSINWDSTWKEEAIVLEELKRKRDKKGNSFIYDSIFQFKAQVHGVSVLKIFILNVISIFSITYLLFKAIFKSNSKSDSTYDGGFYFSLDTVPLELKNNHSIINLDFNHFHLSKEDAYYLGKILLKVNFNLILFSTVLFRILLTSYAKKQYNVKFILCDMEYSAASGILRDYCHKNDIELYNIMHGEKVLTLRDSFCSFDRFYVWSTEYKSMFEQLHANTSFIIYNPWKAIKLSEQENIKDVSGKICYIFKGVMSNEEIDKLQEVFDLLAEKNYEIYAKDHPRQARVSHNFHNINVIDPKTPFLDILDDYEFFISQYSTILSQCYYCDKAFYIDDISDAEMVLKLKERGYVLSNSEFLLSQLLNK